MASTRSAGRHTPVASSSRGPGRDGAGHAGAWPLLPQSGSAAPTPSLDQVKAQLADLATQAEVAQERLNQVRVDIAAAQRVLAQQQAKVARSQSLVSASQVGVGRIASAEYRSGGVDQTMQLLLADNPTQFLEQLAAVDLVSQRQADVLRTASVASQRLAQDRLAASQQLDRLRTLFAQATSDYQEVTAAQAKDHGAARLPPGRSACGDPQGRGPGPRAGGRRGQCRPRAGPVRRRTGSSRGSRRRGLGARREGAHRSAPTTSRPRPRGR